MTKSLIKLNMPVEIVKAQVSDAHAIAEVHVASWKTTYRGIVEDAFLDRLSVSERENQWKRILSESEEYYSCWIAKQGMHVIGFADTGKPRDTSSNFDAELYAIYLLKNSSRKGIGTLLFRQLISDCIKNGFHSMMTWVAEKNESKHFYEALGAHLLSLKKIEKIGANEVVEIAYGWDKLSLHNHNIIN